MALFHRPKPVDDVELIGVRRKMLDDIYHSLIRASTTVSLLVITGTFLLVNLLFAIAYWITGGVEGATTFVDYFFFSIQTSGTIGYGHLQPLSAAANAIVSIEALVSILIVALTTGLVFARFSLPSARVQFVKNPVLSPYDEVPTLMFRFGNERESLLIDSLIRIVVMRTEHTKEGVLMYRMYDLPLARERAPALTRSWTVLHHIVPGSPIFGMTPESMARDELEFILTLTGTDQVSGQPMHAQHRYTHADLRWGMRHADLLSEQSDGRLRLDLTKFHDLTPTAPTKDFPYGNAR